MASDLAEIESVAQWNEALRSATATGRTVVVDFHATWCGPCRQIAPIYSTLAKQYEQVTFLRVDVDKQVAIAQKYKVTAMPTFIFIRSGRPVETIKGADVQSLTKTVARLAGPNPPVAPLPEQAERFKDEGNSLFKEKRYQEAIVKYTEAIEAAPSAFTLYGNRALCYLKLDPAQSERALEDAQKAIELSPTWGKAYVRLGEALELEGRHRDSVGAFEKAISLSEGLVKTEATQKLANVKAKLQ